MHEIDELVGSSLVEIEWSQMSIKTRLVTAFLTLTLLVAIVGLVGIQATSSVNRMVDQIGNETAPDLMILGQMKTQLLRMFSEAIMLQAEHSLMMAGDFQVGDNVGHSLEAKHKTELELARFNFEKWRSEYEQLNINDTEQSFIREFGSIEEEVYSLTQELIVLTENGAASDRVFQKLLELEETEQVFINSIDQAIQYEEEELNQRRGAANRQAQLSFVLIVGVTGASFFIAGALGLFVAKSISNPIIKLKEATALIGGGQLSTNIEISSKDEIGDLAISFNKMAADLVVATTELTTEKEYLDSILASMSDSLIVVDCHGTIQKVNQSTLVLLGLR